MLFHEKHKFHSPFPHAADRDSCHTHYFTDCTFSLSQQSTLSSNKLHSVVHGHSHMDIEIARCTTPFLPCALLHLETGSAKWSAPGGLNSFEHRQQIKFKMEKVSTMHYGNLVNLTVSHPLLLKRDEKVC